MNGVNDGGAKVLVAERPHDPRILYRLLELIRILASEMGIQRLTPSRPSMSKSLARIPGPQTAPNGWPLKAPYA